MKSNKTDYKKSKEVAFLIQKMSLINEKDEILSQILKVAKPVDFLAYFIHFKYESINVCFYDGLRLIQIKGDDSLSNKSLPHQVFIKKFHCSFSNYFGLDIYFDIQIEGKKYTANEFYHKREKEIFDFDFFMKNSDYKDSVKLNSIAKKEINKVKNRAKAVIEKERKVFDEQEKSNVKTIENLKKIFDSKIDHLSLSFKNKIDQILLENSNQEIAKTRAKVIELSNELNIYKSLLQKKENDDKNLLKIKLLERESNDLKIELQRVSVLFNETKVKLENCQKILSYSKGSNSQTTISISKETSEGFISGLDSDGSKGFHDMARENGRFGSLPSFDNYDDDFLDNMKEDKGYD
jgi:hypothetical protein